MTNCQLTLPEHDKTSIKSYQLPIYTHSKPILGLSTIESATFVELFQDYGKDLVQAGYNHTVARLHLGSVAHFGVWLEREGVAVESIDEQTVAAFNRHRSSCRCPCTSRARGRHVVSCIRVFLSHLRERQIAATSAPPEPSLLVREFLGWMSAQRVGFRCLPLGQR